MNELLRSIVKLSQTCKWYHYNYNYKCPAVDRISCGFSFLFRFHLRLFQRNVSTQGLLCIKVFKTGKFHHQPLPQSHIWAEVPKNIASCRYQRWPPSWSLPSVRWWIVTETIGLGETPVVEREASCWVNMVRSVWNNINRMTLETEMAWTNDDELNIPEDNISKFKL